MKGGFRDSLDCPEVGIGGRRQLTLSHSRTWRSFVAFLGLESLRRDRKMSVWRKRGVDDYL